MSGFSRIDQWQPVLVWLLVIATITQLVAVLSAVIFGGFDLDLFGLSIRARTPLRLLIQFLVAAGLLLAVSPRARLLAARLARSPIGFFAAATLLAMWLSLGPVPRAGGQPVSGFGLYGVLYDHVPGFNGVRVPARYAMIAGLFLAVLAGYGARAFSAIRNPQSAIAAFSAAAALIVLEGAAVPIEINRTWAQNEAAPPARVYPARDAPAVYARVKALPAGSAITEFPFGDPAWEIRYVYYAAAHWKPITNGYSGGFPPRYRERVARLQRVAANPDAAWRLLRDSGTTHVVLHRNAFANPADADGVYAWLRSNHAIAIESFPDGDTLFELP